jgi:hypothetical protein
VKRAPDNVRYLGCAVTRRRFSSGCKPRPATAPAGSNRGRHPTSWRVDLWSLIRSTPALDWFLLTKRPQNIGDGLPTDWGEGWPHVCLGTTTENQEEANRRIPHLVAIPSGSSASSPWWSRSISHRG